MTRARIDSLFTGLLAATGIAFLALCFLVALGAPAHAATVAIAPVAIDFSGLVNQLVLPTLQAIVLGVLTWAFAMLGKHYHLQISAQNQSFIETAIADAIGGMQTKLAPGEKISAPGNVAAIAQAAVDAAPKAAAWLNLTPSAVAEKVAARLPA